MSFRSEEMSLVQLFIQTESAYATLSELGELGCIQFRDMNPDVNTFQRTFVKEIRRAEEMERKIRFLQSQLEKTEVKKAHSEEVLDIKSRSVNETDELETRLQDLERELNQINSNDEVLSRNFVELTEMKHVITSMQSLLSNYDDSRFRDEESGRSVKLVFVTGVLDRSKSASFERILWRVLRGNLYMKTEDIEEPIKDPFTGVGVNKITFVVFVQGEQLHNKIRKLSENFGATIYPLPNTVEERDHLLTEVATRLSDLTSVLNKTKDHRRRILSQVAAQIESWSAMVKKEKAIFHNMNQFNVDITSRCLVGEGWCPTKSLQEIRQALDIAADRSQAQVPTIMNVISIPKHVPPTYHNTNKVTSGFQAIIDAYGMASYREVNPAYFAVITFPFLFAVMFGDLGHGLVILAFAMYVCLNEKNLTEAAKGEIFGMIYGGRYILLLMAIFSIYVGFIYNEIFSVGMEIFESGWDFYETGHSGNTTNYRGNYTHVYPLGIDPAWHTADNGLVFINSYKMKMSILLGVLQMTLGIMLSLANHIHFKNYISMIHEFIPQMLFMQSIFGYLCFTIIFKWCTDWTGRNAPSLLNMLINMFLSPGKVPADELLYEGQAQVQTVLLIIALVSIPWMLLVKPILLKRKFASQQYSALHQEEGSSNQTDDSRKNDASAVAPESQGHSHGHGEHFDFGEVFIHQTIHTIEFCLGAISHTASYLRLWALSLAHSQLSIVLWDMTLGTIYTSTSGFIQVIGLFGGFAVWFTLTLGILLGMEGLSAFLHALRLHWVEFDQKFYQGEGHKFVPFSFKRILSGEDD